jgi:hypothetical protein
MYQALRGERQNTGAAAPLGLRFSFLTVALSGGPGCPGLSTNCKELQAALSLLSRHRSGDRQMNRDFEAALDGVAGRDGAVVEVDRPFCDGQPDPKPR